MFSIVELIEKQTGEADAKLCLPFHHTLEVLSILK
jgi:hypothetical protein